MSILSKVPLTASGNVLLIATAQGAGTAGWRVTFLGASWTGSVVLASNTAAPGQAASYMNIAYLTASTGATNTAGTAITSDGDYIIPLSSCAYDLYAVYTHTSGSCAVTVLPEDAGAGGGGLTAAEVDGSASQNTFGAAVPYTGAYTFPGALAITGALTGVTQGTFSTKLVSTTALATPSSLARDGVQCLRLDGLWRGPDGLWPDRGRDAQEPGGNLCRLRRAEHDEVLAGR